MSKVKNIVNPDHFKTEGREPQGQGVAHEVQRQQFKEVKAREKREESRGAAKAARAVKPKTPSK